MSWRTWLTSCLVAALLGVFLGAVYAAAPGRSDARSLSGSSVLPAPPERTSAAGTAGPSPGHSRAADPIEPTAGPGVSKAKPPKGRHDASAASAKSAGKAKKTGAKKTH